MSAIYGHHDTRDPVTCQAYFREIFVMTVNRDEATTYVLARYAGCVYAEPVSVGDNVKRLRQAAGMATQGALAERMGVPQSRVSDLENDRYSLPETRTLMLAATAIGCRVDDLLAGVDPEYDASKNALKILLGTGDGKATRIVTRALRLLGMMSDPGQRYALGLLAEAAKAFPRDRPPLSGVQSDQRHAATGYTGRGKR